jgi:hypothetical protein
LFYECQPYPENDENAASETLQEMGNVWPVQSMEFTVSNVHHPKGFIPTNGYDQAAPISLA